MVGYSLVKEGLEERVNPPNASMQEGIESKGESLIVVSVVFVTVYGRCGEVECK